MRLRPLTVSATALALALAAPAAPALAHGDPLDKVVLKTVIEPATSGSFSNMDFVANVRYEITGGTRGAGGTDIEFGRIGGRDYAFAGTYQNGMQIVDVTDPTAPRKVAVYDCQILQGDIQVFPQNGRVLAAYTADSSFGTKGAASRCGTDLGIPTTALGTVLVDVTDPANPTSVGFAPVPEGSHNITVHPSGNYLYNSNSDLLARTSDLDSSAQPKITIIDIRNPAAPVEVQDFPLPYVPTSLGSESHDVTFSADGTRAYSAALSQTLVLDTTDPAAPRQIAQIVDPAVQVSHGADPITLTRSDGTQRTFLVVSDEQAGAATGTNCPGGGLHFYDITGELERAPQKVAAWFIEESKPSTATCTAHVFRMHSEQQLITVAWYDQGVRVLDLAGFADQPGSPATVLRGSQGGIREIGAFVFDDANTWSFKTHRIAADGSFYGFGNDLGRGLDVYRFAGLGRTVPPLEPRELLSGPGKKYAPKPATNPQLLSGAPVAGLGLLALLGNVALVRRRNRG